MTDDSDERRKDQREWDELLAYGHARFRATLQAEGLDPDNMTEDEKMDYVVRVIHEHRQEQQEQQEREPF